MKQEEDGVRKKTVHIVDVVRHGEKFIIPEQLTYDNAIELLQRKKRAEEEYVSISETIDAFIWDGALALARAMKKKFGYAQGETTYSFFGPNRPKMISVDVGYQQVESVPWGNFTLPGIEGTFSSGYEQKDGILIFKFTAEVKKKHEDQIRELAEIARKIVRKDSIYKGKAFTVRWCDDKGDILPLPEPKFLNLNEVKEGEIIFSEEVEKDITTSLFTPIEKSEECRKAGIPLKRGVLLSGKYGTGKTLVTYITAKKSVDNNWTFLHVQRADELAQMVRFAHKYQPAVIFCEDIDRVLGGERDTDMDEILNIIDGIEAKNTELMVILTTNHIENINAAMLRPGRLDAVINVLPPDKAAVMKLIKLFGRGLIGKNEDLTEVAKMMAGQIPAVVRECVERSKLASIKLNKGGEMVITAAALVDAAIGMKNQINLLAKQSQTTSLNERVGKVLGEAVTKGLDVDGAKLAKIEKEG